MFLNLGLLTLGFGLRCLGAVPVLLCLVIGARQNCNHSLTLLLQPGADRQLLSAAAVPSAGEPSLSFFDTLGSYFCPEGLPGEAGPLPVVGFGGSLSRCVTPQA